MIAEDHIRKTIAEVLQLPPEMLTPEAQLYLLPDFDSVKLLTVIVALHDIGVIVPAAQAAKMRTFGDILALRRE